ncbi:MAG: FAD-binding protein [Anaerolineae bacterium]|nr:FAD-binding protein [Anaerolineae bacterium]
MQAGCTWGDLDHATHAFGLATPGGLVSTTGVAGLTLGGGIGHLSRKHGLACDNLLAAQVVTADGRILTASPSENADLFWGLRGGGGNFGVVTSFEFQLHSVSVVLGGPIFYALDQCDAVLRFYRDFIADAPAELGAFLPSSRCRRRHPFPSISTIRRSAGSSAAMPVRWRKGRRLSTSAGVRPAALRPRGPGSLSLVAECV